MIHRTSPPTSFDPENGLLIRSEDVKPSSPELFDIAVTSVCSAGCQMCYRSATNIGKHADIEWMKAQLLSMPEMPFEIALGGGEPTAWPALMDFIKWCRGHNIVPNAAIGPAADLDVVQQIVKKGQLGSLGVSIVPGMDKSLHVMQYVRKHAEIPVRAHCIIRKDWVTTWIAMAGILPRYVDGIVFLNFKPHGRGEDMAKLVPSIIDIQQIFEVYRKLDISVGFDSCCACALKHIVPAELLDECDGGKYSMFIDAVAQEFSQCSFLPCTPFGDIMLNEVWDKMDHISTCAYAAKEVK